MAEAARPGVGDGRRTAGYFGDQFAVAGVEGRRIDGIEGNGDLGRFGQRNYGADVDTEFIGYRYSVIAAAQVHRL